MNRRQFLNRSATAGLVLGSGLLTPQIACAQLSDYWKRDRVLWLKRGKHEEFRVVYWSDGQIDPANYQRLCYLLRDANESTTVQMDPKLLDLLYGMQRWQELLLNRPVPLVVSSGYRTERHNAQIEGAALNSLHLYGKAADIQSPHFSPTQIAEMATFFEMGGVGRYRAHTHVDSGRIRYWNRLS